MVKPLKEYLIVAFPNLLFAIKYNAILCSVITHYDKYRHFYVCISVDQTCDYGINPWNIE